MTMTGWFMTDSSRYDWTVWVGAELTSREAPGVAFYTATESNLWVTSVD